MNQERNVEGVMSFRGSRGGSVGLRLETMERMKWERGVGDGERRREVNVERKKEHVGIGGGWIKFGCYVD